MGRKLQGRRRTEKVQIDYEDTGSGSSVESPARAKKRMKQLRAARYLRLKQILQKIGDEEDEPAGTGGQTYMNIQVEQSPTVSASPVRQLKVQRLTRHLNRLENKGEISQLRKDKLLNQLIRMSPLAKSQDLLPQIHRHYQLDSYESYRELNSEDEDARDDERNKAMLDSYE